MIYKKIPEIEKCLEEHPWILDHNIADDDYIAAVIQENFPQLVVYFLQFFGRLNVEVIHPLLLKTIYNYNFETDHSYKQNIEDKMKSLKRTEKSWGLVVFESKQMTHAENLASLPEKYLTVEDRDFIANMTIRKLTK